MKQKITELDQSAWTHLTRKPKLTVGVHESPWGWVMVGLVGRDLAALKLVERGKEVASAMDQFAADWPGSPVGTHDKGTEVALKKAVASWRGGKGKTPSILLLGTTFQRQVWRALLDIPSGETTTYGEIARRLGHPQKARAVGQAVGANPVGVLVPCHRVLASSGKIGGYAWGVKKKKALLRAESVKKSAKK